MCVSLDIIFLISVSQTEQVPALWGGASLIIVGEGISPHKWIKPDSNGSVYSLTDFSEQPMNMEPESPGVLEGIIKRCVAHTQALS